MIKNIHNFHLVLNSKLKEKVDKFSKKMKLSMSDAVIYILTESICVLNKYQFDLQESTDDLNYQKIDWDSDMHIYLENNFYRKIKHLSDTVFSFSVAIVVRKLIDLYFKMLEKCKGKIERVKRVFRKFYLIYVKKYGTTLKKWNKEIKEEQLYGKYQYNLIFNDKFTITGFNFNNSF